MQVTLEVTGVCGPISPGDIPRIQSQEKRLEELLVDCYGPYEELAAFEVCFTDALAPPFAATWRDPDEEGHAEPVTVLGLAEVDDRRGVLLRVRRESGSAQGWERRVPADEVWADEPGANATVLGDYRYWLDHGGGLPEEDYE